MARRESSAAKVDLIADGGKAGSTLPRRGWKLSVIPSAAFRSGSDHHRVMRGMTRNWRLWWPRVPRDGGAQLRIG